MDITDEEKLFIEELVRRIPPAPNVIIKTRNGELVVTQAEKARLDKIARREGIGDATNLIRFYLPPNQVAGSTPRKSEMGNDVVDAEFEVVDEDKKK